MSRDFRFRCCLLLLGLAPLLTAQPDAERKEQRVQRRTAAAANNPAPKPDFADLSYGPDSHNVLDLWLAKSSAPAPLVVFIHGGGFTGGDKSAASPANIRLCLEKGVSYAAINYRFRTQVPIQTVLRDCARAVQFLRVNAKKYNLDKTRVASMGGSAGAGTSLWLAFHDNLADPKNPDPVLRESSRLTAAAATATQATYDIVQWAGILGDAVNRFSRESDWPKFYGLDTIGQVRGPEGKKIRADVDMLGLITKDDPPVFLISSSDRDKLASLGDINHTSLHARAVKKRCDEVGVEAVLRVTGDAEFAGDAKEGPIEFLLQHLGKH
jgi:acetyl esterase/lipase